MQERGVAAYIAEFVGTFILVFAITAAVSGALTPGAGSAGLTVVALVHGFALFLLIQTLAVASGAHFNPAVTVALTAMRQIKPSDAAILHLGPGARRDRGGTGGQAPVPQRGNADAVHYGAPAVSDVLHGSTGRGMLGEFIGTFFLLFG